MMNSNKIMEKKKLLLIPSAFNSSVMGDVNLFIDIYKNKLDVYVISDMFKETIVKKDGVNYIKYRTDYAYYLIYTADYIIDAGSVNSSSKISPLQRRISVWHGIPYKKMFIDLDIKYLAESLNYSSCYDLMLSPSKFYTEKFLRNSMLYNGEVYETTMPRLNNLLINNNKDNITDLKEKLGLPTDKKVFLYAPTMRETGKFDLACDFKKIKKILGEDWIIIAKAHYMNYFDTTIGIDYDFTKYKNINDILLVCDVLVTDYSSVMFDYSVLNKPIIFFNYDYEEYASNRGFTFDINTIIDKKNIAYTKQELYEICEGLAVDINQYLSENFSNKFYEHQELRDYDKLVTKLNFDDTPRTHRDITFLVNDLHQIGGVHNFILNFARLFKSKYNCRINVLGINEHAVGNEQLYTFDEENIIDFKASGNMKIGFCKNFLENTDGYIISCQFSSHLYFQKHLREKKVIAMFHGDTKDIVNKTLYHWHLDAINNRKLYNYNRFLTLTHNNENLIKKHIRPKQIRSITSSIENSFDFSDSKNLHKNSNIFVAITRLDIDKNIFALIEIFKNKYLNNDVILHVYGDGPLKDEMVSRIKEHNLENRIILKGYCNDKEKIFNNKQGLISVSLTEGFPLIILEAVNYYIPVILFDSFTAAKELAEGVGQLITTNDFDSFAKAMNSANNYELKNFEEVQNKFSNETIMLKWEKLFNELNNEKSTNIQANKIFYYKKSIKGKLVLLNRKLRKLLQGVIKNKIRRNIIYIYRSFQYYTNLKINKSVPLVSIVLPYYYNSEVIGTAINSLRNLKYKNIEIIVVNDCSDDYNFIDKTIKYYKLPKNVGVGNVRNFGVSKATGKYIAFVDSDDTLNKYGLSFMVNYAEENNLDVVSAITRRLDVATGISHIWYKNIYNKKYINAQRERELLLSDVLSTNKIYNREALEKYQLKFESGLYEDKLFTAQLYKNVDKIGIVNTDYYVWNYYGSETSISSRLSTDNFNERLDKIEKIMLDVNDAFKVNFMSLFINHDLVIYVNQFNKYNEDEKKLIFAKSKNIVNQYKQFLKLKFISQNFKKELASALLKGDYKRFHLISTLHSKQFLKE
ncbi:MAG: CDP-glycerol glycerophosphotransferase family protein [Bacilli bacterium]